MAKVTIKDVAKEAGVSFSTVSKVINNSPTISDKTANHVREVMRRLNYAPNQRAASFARGSTKAVAFVADITMGEVFRNPHMFEILAGAQQKLQSRGFSMQLVNASGEAEPGDAALRLVESGLVDGVIVHGSATNRCLASMLVRSGFPHIFIGRPDFETEACWIDTNNQISGGIAARHLLENGVKKIVFLGGREVDQISQHRQQGYLAAMEEAGLAVPPQYIRCTDSSIEDSYREAMRVLRHKQGRPEGMICENNMIAIGALRAIRELSLQMPRDLAFVTFDNYPFSQVMEPQPTVVDIDVFEMGEDAAGMLLRKIKNPGMQVQSYTTLPKLTVRGTSVEDLGLL